MQKPSKEVAIGTIYLIHNRESGLHKLGITVNWTRRKRELEVGTKNTEVMTATVIEPLQIEQSLFRKYKAERLPQTEYLKLSQNQVLEVIKLFDTEASKLKGDDADLHLKYAALEYEIKKAGANVPVKKLFELEKIKRQLYPEYNARVIAREAQKQAEIQRKREEDIEWNRRGRWWNAFFSTMFVFLIFSFVPVLLIRVFSINSYIAFHVYTAIAYEFMFYQAKISKRRIDE